MERHRAEDRDRRSEIRGRRAKDFGFRIDVRRKAQGARQRAAGGDRLVCINKYKKNVFINTIILYLYVQFYLDKYSSKS